MKTVGNSLVTVVLLVVSGLLVLGRNPRTSS